MITGKNLYKPSRTEKQQELPPGVTEEFDDFVGIFKGAFTDEFCSQAIKFFDFSEANTNFVQKRNTEFVSDKFLFSSTFFHCEDPQIVRMTKDLSDYFYQALDFCLDRYRMKYNILDGLHSWGVFDLKFQKTAPMQGFHGWHYENVTKLSCSRKLVIQLYLNDVNEGGETEFLYYPKRINAEKGKLLIWPAGFTHTHRGNAPLKDNKYIITSWVEILQ